MHFTYPDIKRAIISSPHFSPVFEAKGAKRNEIRCSRKMRERRRTVCTLSERIEKAPKIVVFRTLQQDTSEKCGLDSPSSTRLFPTLNLNGTRTPQGLTRWLDRCSFLS